MPRQKRKKGDGQQTGDLNPPATSPRPPPAFYQGGQPVTVSEMANKFSRMQPPSTESSEGSYPLPGGRPQSYESSDPFYRSSKDTRPRSTQQSSAFTGFGTGYARPGHTYSSDMQSMGPHRAGPPSNLAWTPKIDTSSSNYPTGPVTSKTRASNLEEYTATAPQGLQSSSVVRKRKQILLSDLLNPSPGPHAATNVSGSDEEDCDTTTLLDRISGLSTKEKANTLVEAYLAKFGKAGLATSSCPSFYDTESNKDYFIDRPRNSRFRRMNQQLFQLIMLRPEEYYFQIFEPEDTEYSSSVMKILHIIETSVRHKYCVCLILKIHTIGTKKYVDAKERKFLPRDVELRNIQDHVVILEMVKKYADRREVPVFIFPVVVDLQVEECGWLITDDTSIPDETFTHINIMTERRSGSTPWEGAPYPRTRRLIYKYRLPLRKFKWD